MTEATWSGSVFIVAGTRPEIIKLAPLYRALRAEVGREKVRWISTGQHLELERLTLAHFGVVAEHTLDIRADGDGLSQLHAQAVNGVSALIAAQGPALLIVQGDTLSGLAASFAAFHCQIPLAHVEAGLRTGNTHNPFPEEAYRRMIDTMADLRFAPTRHAAANLLAEKMRPETIYVTGNTGVDALIESDSEPSEPLPVRLDDGKTLVFVTLHRRESWGEPLERMCLAVRDIMEDHPGIEVVLPLHVNPNVRKSIFPILADLPRLHLIEPVDFDACHRLIRRASLILTDSGGIQEEAPSYGVPTLVLREATERPEVIESGQAILVGTDRKRIVSEATRLLASPKARAAMRGAGNPFGDGQASVRIARALRRYLHGERVLLTAGEEFTPAHISATG